MLISTVIYLDRTESFLNLKALCVLVILITLCVASILVNGSSGGALFYILLICIAFFSLFVVDLESFFSYYCKFLDVICIVSIITMLAIFFVPSVLSLFPMYENMAGTLFSNFFIGGFFDLNIGGSKRAIGIFREPGVFAAYIVVGIIFDNYLNERKRKRKRYLIYSVALLLTQSTAGYLAFFVLCLPKIKKIFFSEGEISSKFLVVFSIGIVSWVLINFGVYDGILDKFTDGSNTYSNYLARSASITANLNILSNNLFLGTGFGAYKDLFATFTFEAIGVALNSESHSTNTWLAQGAIWGGVMLIFNVLLFVISSIQLANGRKFEGMIVFVTMLILFSSQDMRFSHLFNMLLFIGIVISSKRHNTKGDNYAS
jgi:hypothetical protein